MCWEFPQFQNNIIKSMYLRELDEPIHKPFAQLHCPTFRPSDKGLFVYQQKADKDNNYKV